MWAEVVDCGWNWCSSDGEGRVEEVEEVGDVGSFLGG